MKFIATTVLCTAAMVSLAAPAQTIDLPYESVFKDYQAHKEVKLLDWKTSNEAVRAAGGWRAYQKESQAPDITSTSPISTKVTPPAHHSSKNEVKP